MFGFSSSFDYDYGEDQDGPPPPPEFNGDESAPPQPPPESNWEDSGPHPPPEFNEDEARPNNASTVLGADQGIQTTLKSLSGNLQNMKCPDGSQANPAKTCQDIKQCHPLKKTGDYWLDPNQGSTKDVIKVFCNMETGETCISAHPISASIPRKTWWTKSTPTASKPVWFGANMNGGTKFSYGNKEELPNAVTIQMRLIRLLSKEGVQNVTYHCKNSVAVNDGATGNLKKALILKGSNGQEVKVQGNSHLRYTVLEDGCSKSNGDWGKTEIEYKTQTPARLPIVDLAPMDIGKEDQEFGLDIGPVCFS
eukprot:XP_014006488.1 PREDICTED: collagen alpha-1(II) chain-like [Salmo salar]